MKIGIISDTHGYLGSDLLHNLSLCDEIWHAGDWGGIEVYDKLLALKKTVRGVYGNIDEKIMRLELPAINRFTINNHQMMITHIGGYPGHYNKNILPEISNHSPDIFIAGHSHILKIMPDNRFNFLYINPGAAGQYGAQQVKTMVILELGINKIENLNVVELS